MGRTRSIAFSADNIETVLPKKSPKSAEENKVVEEWVEQTLDDRFRSGSVLKVNTRSAMISYHIEALPEEPEPKTTKPKQTESQWVEVLLELLSSEKTYVHALVALQDVSFEAIYGFPQDITSITDVSVLMLYKNVRELVLANSNLCTDLEVLLDPLTKKSKSLDPRKKDSIIKQVSELFLFYSKLFYWYGQYAQNYGIVVKIIQDLFDSNSDFKMFLEEAHFDPRCSNQSFFSLLIMPIQRIPRYILLLSELKRKLDSKTPKLNEAVESLEKSAAYINECVRDRENRESLCRLEMQFPRGSELMKPGRFLVRTGTLIRITSKSSSKKQVFHLFNDTLTYSDEVAFGFVLKRSIELSKAIKIDLSRSYGDLYGTYPAELGFVFESMEKSFAVLCNSVEEMNSWVNDINKYVEESMIRIESYSADSTFSDTTSLAPITSEKYRSTQCHSCSRYFGKFKRKRICKKWYFFDESI